MTDSREAELVPEQSRAREGADKLMKAKAALMVPLTKRDLIIRECVQLMDATLWRPGITTRELAEKHGVTHAAMEHNAADAATFIRLRDDENCAAKGLVTRLDDWLSWADVAPDRAQLLKLKAEIIGLIGPRAERRAKMAETASAMLSDNDLRELLRDPPVELVTVLEECGWRRG